MALLLAIASLAGCKPSPGHADTASAVALPSHATPPSAAAVSPAQDEAHRAGLVYGDVPADSIGFLFGSEEFVADSVAYSVAHVGTSRGQELWLSRGDRYRPGFDSTTWTVIASIIPTQYYADASRIWLAPCTRNGKPDDRLVVMLQYEEVAVLDKIVRAWHADPGVRRFVPIDTVGIKCPRGDSGE